MEAHVERVRGGVMSVVTQDPTADDGPGAATGGGHRGLRVGGAVPLLPAPQRLLLGRPRAVRHRPGEDGADVHAPAAGYFAPAFARCRRHRRRVHLRLGLVVPPHRPLGAPALRPGRPVLRVGRDPAAPFAISITVQHCPGVASTPSCSGPVWSATGQAGLSAPFAEESAKAAGFILLMGLARGWSGPPADGLVLGAFIGLGFATFEDFLYAAKRRPAAFGTDPVGNAVHSRASPIACLRRRLAPDVQRARVHRPRSTCIGTPAQPRRVGRGLALVAAGVGIHLFWDSMLVLSAELDVPTLVVLVFAMVVEPRPALVRVPAQGPPGARAGTRHPRPRGGAGSPVAGRADRAHGSPSAARVPQGGTRPAGASSPQARPRRRGRPVRRPPPE